MLLCIVLVYEIQMAEVSLPLGSAVPQRFFKGWTSNTVMISLIQAVRTFVYTCINMNMKKCWEEMKWSVWCHTVLCFVCCTVYCSIELSSTVWYSIVYCAAVSHSVLHCTVIHFISLYWTLLYTIALFCNCVQMMASSICPIIVCLSLCFLIQCTSDP